MNKISALRCACLAISTLLGARDVYPAIFNIPDGDVVGLKAAITAANNNGASDTINLAQDGIYTLTAIDNFTNGPSGLPEIRNDAETLDLTINGHGAVIQRIAVPGAPKFRVLQIGEAAEVTCNDLTLSHGEASGEFPANAGGAVYAQRATLNLAHCAFLDNTAGPGGAIFQDAGSLTVVASLFDGNFADAGPTGLAPAMGGAIAN